MRRLSENQRNSVLASINGWAPRVIDEYIDIEREEKSGVINADTLGENTLKLAKELAATLYQVGQQQSIVPAAAFIAKLEAGDELGFILKLMDNPCNVRPMDRTLRGHENEMKEIIAARFIAFADTICKEYVIDKFKLDLEQQPQLPLPSAPPFEEFIAEQMNYIINFRASISASKELYNKRKQTIQYITDSAKIASLGFFYMAFGCFYCAGDCGELGLALAGVGVFLLLLGIAVSAATYLFVAAGASLIYGVTKFIDSLAKITTVLYNPINSIRGLLRAAMIGIGTLGAVKGGMLAGALLGTAIAPGLGSAIGAALGAVVGGFFGIGLAAYISKHALQLISSTVSSNPINPSNPYRYTLTTIQKTRLDNMGVRMDEFNSVLKELKAMKQNIPFWARIKSSDNGRKFKREVNNIIEDLKNGLIVEEKIEVNGKIFTLFDQNSKVLHQQPARNHAYLEPSAPPFEAEDYGFAQVYDQLLKPVSALPFEELTPELGWR